jgi:RecQ family ATP-dependent DNA helicase
VATTSNTKTSKPTPKTVLKNVFGYDEFNLGQEDIISNIVSGKDTLAILPTGGGKSLCFQIPGLILPGITLVISPLISLMKDQVDTLIKKSVKACFLNSSLSKKEFENNLQLIKSGEMKFVYIAPERLKSDKFAEVLKNTKISLLVIDEAHCISQWGDDFRPSYKQISNIYPIISKKTIRVAFTATANQEVQNDIINSLRLRNPFIFFKSFKRSNLSLEVLNCENTAIKNLILMRLLQKHRGQAGIIYCATRKMTENLAKFLQNFNHNVAHYHARLDADQKNQLQADFQENRTPVITATNAFGMGVDKSDIRFVIHYQLPGNLENYYQEVGRAGRDRAESDCYLLFCPQDINIQKEFLKNSLELSGANQHSNANSFTRKFNKLKKIVDFCQYNSCRTGFVLDYFGEVPDDCLKCDNCKIKVDSNYLAKSQILYKAGDDEITLIKKLLNLKNSAKDQNYPLSNYAIAYLSLLRPKTSEEFLKIPGVGCGWMQQWCEEVLTCLELPAL